MHQARRRERRLVSRRDQGDERHVGKNLSSENRNYAVKTDGVDRRKLTAREVSARKGGEKLVMLAAYDVATARATERAGIDLILVGDSLGMVVLGYETTVPVTVDDIVHHCRAVVRGAPRTHVVADLPFLSYHLSDAQALENAGRLMQQGGADSVKLEGGRTVAGRIRALVDAGIPVMGHLGLTPQRVGVIGGFRVQGRDRTMARQIVEDAEMVASAGAYALVLELVPTELARIVSERVPIPTIGIGAGPECDGQVLVAADLLGLDDRPPYRFVKRYAEVGAAMTDAFTRYAADVRGGAFPTGAQSYPMNPEEVTALRDELDESRSEPVP
jgi:3-methyl-2-oxobutanoate hydroxymethyltransferase